MSPIPSPGLADPLPENFEFQLLQPDWDHFEPIMELALGRVPALREVGVKQMINGPESFTPDGNFILGEAPEVRNIFVGAGFNAFGIASGGGAGMALAEWVVKGAPPFDLWPADIRRFGRNHLDPDWVRSRTLEAYSKHYTMAWPSEEYRSGRPLRRSPLYDRLSAAGAVFGEKLGWERANWFAEKGEPAEDRYTYERPNWFDAVAREHRAARQTAALFDQTSFAKFRLSGPDAETVLSQIAANDVRKADGAVIYTQMLNDAGGIEADLTVVRHAKDSFTLVTGTGFATHDFHWIRVVDPARRPMRRLSTSTSQTAVLVIMGPKSREILQTLTRDDISNAAFPFATARDLIIAGAPALALRITYVGELGYELHVPVEFAASLYDAIQCRRRAARPADWPAIGRSRPFASKRAIAPGAPRSAPTTLRLWRDLALRETEDEPAVPRPGRARSAARRAPASPARGLHGGKRRHPAGPRDDLSERRACRLAGERRLRPHRGQSDRLWLRQARRRRRRGFRDVR